MNEKTKNIIKAIAWVVVVLIALCGGVGLLYHFGRGIYCSCVADDIITAQDRVQSSYQFLRMLLAGLVMIGALIGEYFLKDNVILGLLKNEKK